MSRRRPARSNKHLERDVVLAEVLEQAQRERSSKGPCPGQCNRAYRRRVEQHADALLVQLGKGTRWARERVAVELCVNGQPPPRAKVDAFMVGMRDAVLEDALNAARREVRVPDPRVGRPVWCLRCTAEIKDALHNLPLLVAWVVDVGCPGVPTRWDGLRPVPVTDLVEVLSLNPDGWWHQVEGLACGHTHRVPFGPVVDPEPGRQCLTCIASTSGGEPGRLSPPPKSARSSSTGRPPVSPAGSPAWVEADAGIEWACWAAEDARHMLGLAPPHDRWSAATSAFRFRELVRAVQLLEQYVEPILESRRSVAFGGEVLSLATRLRRVSGMDQVTHHLPASCPACDRRSLERPDGGDRIRCSRCYRTWDETEYSWLVRTQEFEQEHPELQADDAPIPATEPPEPVVPRPCTVLGCARVGEVDHHHHLLHGERSPVPCQCARGRRTRSR